MAETETRAAPPPASTEVEENKENQDCEAKNAADAELKMSEMKIDSAPSAGFENLASDLLQSRSELLGRVQNLKKDLQEWRGKLDSQVSTYRQELGELRSTLNSEVEQLRDEFQALRSTLKRQMDVTIGLAELGPNSSPEEVTPST